MPQANLSPDEKAVSKGVGPHCLSPSQCASIFWIRGECAIRKELRVRSCDLSVQTASQTLPPLRGDAELCNVSFSPLTSIRYVFSIHKSFNIQHMGILDFKNAEHCLLEFVDT